MQPPQWSVADAFSDQESQAREVIQRLGPRAAFAELLQRNDAQIRSPELDTGRAIATARTALYTALTRHWAEEQVRQFGYDRPFAVVALGGTGRGEMAPYSDVDFALLFDNALEGNPFLLELQRQLLHTAEFESRYGFANPALPFSLDDVPSLEGKQLNAFLDLRPVYDPHGLGQRFRERIRATSNPFEHFLHVRAFWKERWEQAAALSERLDRFDIKNEGLRLFLAGIWILAGRRFVHSHWIYETLEDPRDLAAYDFLMRIRAFVHLRRPPHRPESAGGNHPEDLLGFGDFTAFGELLGPEATERDRFDFGNEVRARLLSARRRVAMFSKGVIEHELKTGREVGPGDPVVYGVGGLFHSRSEHSQTPEERSRAALSLLLASQRYGVPIDLSELQTTFRNAGDWMEPVPELGLLFLEPRGSLAASLEFLSQLDGTADRLFPGYARFEVSLDQRVMAERFSLRGALERQKIRALEHSVQEGRALLSRAVHADQPGERPAEGSSALEAALLDSEQLAAVKLALKTKRLPLTPEDLEVQGDLQRPLFERFSTGFSGIPLEQYYEPYHTRCGLSRDLLRLVEFLVAHRRAFKRFTAAGINDEVLVREFAELCGDEHHLRALYVFTCADRAEWDSEAANPARWSNTRELYDMTQAQFRPRTDPTHALTAAGYSRQELAILRDFGEAFFGGRYRHYANRFGSHLLRLAEHDTDAVPKVVLLRDGAAHILGVAARDYRGLAATISGALWNRKIDIRQAHLFSAMNHGLALDFFHIHSPSGSIPSDLTRGVAEAIQQRRYIADDDEAALPSVPGRASLREWRPGQYCLQFESAPDTAGLIYTLTYKVYRHLQGNIFALSAHRTAAAVFVSVYLNLPPELSEAEALHRVAERF